MSYVQIMNANWWCFHGLSSIVKEIRYILTNLSLYDSANNLFQQHTCNNFTYRNNSCINLKYNSISKQVIKPNNCFEMNSSSVDYYDTKQQTEQHSIWFIEISEKYITQDAQYSF